MITTLNGRRRRFPRNHQVIRMSRYDDLRRMREAKFEKPVVASTKGNSVVSTECPVCVHDGKQNVRQWLNGELHDRSHNKPNRRQSHRYIKRRPHPHNLHAAARRRPLLANTRRTINRQHRHHLVIRPRPLGTALHYRPSRPPHRKGKSLRKGRITVRASPVHALFQDSRCQIAPSRL